MKHMRSDWPGILKRQCHKRQRGQEMVRSRLTRDERAEQTNAMWCWGGAWVQGAAATEDVLGTSGGM